MRVPAQPTLVPSPARELFNDVQLDLRSRLSFAMARLRDIADGRAPDRCRHPDSFYAGYARQTALTALEMLGEPRINSWIIRI